MKNDTKFLVSCFNDITGAAIYIRQAVFAQNQVRARKLADEQNTNLLIALEAGTTRRYIISPMGAGRL